jgi:nucleotide-binding universal stress UspA family protein
MNKILCAFDRSAEAMNAFDYAVEMTKELNAKLYLINVISIQTGGADIDPAIDAELIHGIYEAAKSDFQEWTQDLEKRGIKCECKQEVGIVGNEILKYAENIGADCIIMGNTQSGKLEEKILGSTISSVILNSNCPVMIIPLEVKHKHLKVAAWATDFKNYSNENLQFLNSFLGRFNCSLHTIHITNILDNFDEKGFENFKGALRTHLKAVQEIYFKNEFSDDIDLSVNEFVKIVKADLLIVVHKHRGFLSSLFHRSKSLSISHQHQVPVMVLQQ